MEHHLVWKSRQSVSIISLTTVQTLIGSMSDRWKAVIKNKGDTVSILTLSLCTVLEKCCRCVGVPLSGVATLLSIVIVAEQLSVLYRIQIVLLLIPMERYKVCNTQVFAFKVFCNDVCHLTHNDMNTC